jgi:4Fe-4S single cluster domain
MIFCNSPWTNIDFSPTGNISPCCKFRTEHYDQQFNIQRHTIDEYKNSELLSSVKQEFFMGAWPRGCERCRIEEENGIESKRQLDQQRWYELYALNDGDTFVTASIAFGNTCNLKCITCNPRASSKWQPEYRDIYLVDIKPHHFYKRHFVDDFLKFAPTVKHIDIPGGEPFLSGVSEQKRLLQHYVDNNLSKDITLHYTTNATVFPEQSWWDIWKNFKEIDIQISVDGVGERYEYIRFPANWLELNSNVDQYLEKAKDNIRLSVSHTVSAYNIYYIDEFFAWCYNKGLPEPWLGRVHNPTHMRPSVWPNHAKQIIINKLLSSDNPTIQTWAGLMSNTDDSSLFKEFRIRLHQHDSYRDLKFVNTFPELAPYV